MKSLIKRALVVLWSAILVFSVAAQQKRIYLAPDDHTDYMWTADEATYQKALLTMTDYYLDRMDATANDPSQFQARWNADGSFWLRTYQQNRTDAQFQRLMNRIKDGHFSSPLNALVLVNGGTPAEAVLRGMYYPGLLERKFGVRFPLAVAMEDQTFPFGLPSLWAGAGAKYSWKGVCGCASKVTNLNDRDREIYYLGGNDNSKVLLKWNSQLSGNQNIGGYAETRYPSDTVNLVDTNANFRSRYPYNVIGAFGQGWDDLQTTDNACITAARNLSNSNRQIFVSNQLDFFADFESNYAANLPTFAASYGNEWELLTASMAEVSARVKRDAEKLRAAEAMTTLAALKNPSFLNARQGSRDTAMLNFGLYFEHNWTADGPISRSDRAGWQRRIEGGIASYVNQLYDESKGELGAQIGKSGDNQRVFVFNSLSWARTDYADFAFGESYPVYVVDLTTGQETPSQIVSVDGQKRLRIFAQNVPSVGYKVFEIRSGTGANFGNAANVNGNIIENDFYKITVSNAGAITSLIDKTRGNREFVRTINGKTVNDFGVGSGGALTVENAGAVSVTIRADSTVAPAHTTRITLARNSNRIEIRNDITQNFGDVRTWAFSFDLDSPDVKHEEVGAVIRAKLLADGGNYSPKNARYDWLTVNHFADMSNGANSNGVTLSNADDYFMQLGNSTTANLDTATPQIKVLAGGQVDGGDLGIPNQNGDSQFMQRFALTTHDAFNQRAAMQFALEHQNPLVAGDVTGRAANYDAAQFSFLTISNPNVLLWALKPAEDGINAGIAARVWNMANAPTDYTLSLAPDITSATRTTHIETEIAPATVTNGDLAASINQQQIQTHVLQINKAATTTISGRVTIFNSRGVGKIKITLTNTDNGVTRQTVTSGNGYYRFDAVPVNGDYNIAARRVGYKFEPSAQSFYLQSARDQVNFAVRR